MNIQINNETGTLKTVILGIAKDKGPTKYLNNPKYEEIVLKGEDPKEEVLVSEIEYFKQILEKHEVEVLRPTNISQKNQIFCRDIGFAIGNQFFLGGMKKENRRIEIDGLKEILSSIPKVNIPPKEAYIEGGDIIVWKNYIFVGLGDRTNVKGVEFLKEKINGEKEIITFDLQTSNNPNTNILHLDTAFQPVGEGSAIIYINGFKKLPTPILDVFGEKNLIKISQKEMYNLYSNILSINPELAIIEIKFERLADELKKRSINTIPINYGNISKLGGLMRCSTSPLYRDNL